MLCFRVIYKSEVRAYSMKVTTVLISLMLSTVSIAPANAQKIKNGNYWQSNGLQFLQVKGTHFRLSARGESHSSWEPISRLETGKKGVLLNRGRHWCMSPKTPSPLTPGARCSDRGWNMKFIWLPKNQKILS